MTLSAECGVTLVRAACVSAVALALGYPVRALLANAPGRWRSLAWALLLIPYLAPVVIVGYAYSNFSLSLVRHPAANELFYDLLLILRLTPVAALVLYLAPTYLTREALHCRRLLLAGEHATHSARESISFLVHGPARQACVGWVVVFLLAFPEFEMASLMNVRTWTIKLFDAQAGGGVLSESLRLAALPVLAEGLLVLAAAVMLLGSRRPPESAPDRPPSPTGARRVLTWGYLLLAVVGVCAVPAFITLRGTAGGLRVLLNNPALVKDVAASLLFGTSAAALAYLAASGFVRPGRWTIARLLPALVLAFPGMLGGLLLSLLVLSLFQLTFLRPLYDTPVPLMLALTLLLLPFAILLRVLLHAARPGESMHTAVLLGTSDRWGLRRNARQLIWELRTRSRVLVLGLLFSWAYFEVVGSALLAPSGMTPVFVRLYNLMHYGQMAGLSAMVLAAFCAPLVLLGLTFATRRLFVLVRTYD